GVRLRDLLGVEPLALEHVQEVGIAAEIELVCPIDADAANREESGQDSMGDGRADLALDVVANDRNAALLESVRPVFLAGDEDRNAVDEHAARLEHLIDIPLGRHLGADRQVGDNNVGVGVFEDFGDIGGRTGHLGDDLREVFAEAVVRHATLDFDAELRHVGELDRVVRTAEDRLAEVLAYLVGVDVERGRELDIADVIAAQAHVHQTGNERIVGRIPVVLDALDKRRGAIAYADDRYADLSVMP